MAQNKLSENIKKLKVDYNNFLGRSVLLVYSLLVFAITAMTQEPISLTSKSKKLKKQL